MSKKIEQYQEELNNLAESVEAYDEKWIEAGRDYNNGIRNYLEKADDYVNVVYDEGLNDAWECVKKIVDMEWSTRHEVLNDPSMSLYGLLSNVTPKRAIKMVKKYEEDKNRVTRRSIIKTKLDEIKDMLEDPVTNGELIKILEEEGDTDEIGI